MKVHSVNQPVLERPVLEEISARVCCRSCCERQQHMTALLQEAQKQHALARSTQDAHACAALFHHFKDPIMITQGKMQYLYDDKGRRYLDVSTLPPALQWQMRCILNISGSSIAPYIRHGVRIAGHWSA